MKIVTIVKHVPDADSPIRATNGSLDTADTNWVLDGMDEYGVEQAVRIKDERADVEVVVLALGTEQATDAVRAAMALGADRGRHVVAPGDVDPIVAARVLSHIIRDEAPALVFVGGKQADWDSSALGPALAEFLGWPLSEWTTSMSIRDDSLEVVHDVDDGTEALLMTMPAVITTQQGLNEPRYPSLPNKMRARRKPIDTVDFATVLQAIGGSTTSTAEVTGYTSAARTRQRRVVDGDTVSVAQELAQLLREPGAA